MGRYKAIEVDMDSHIYHLIPYIHANPLDLKMPKWRKGELINLKKAKKFLEEYPWSSYALYTANKKDGLISQIIKRVVLDKLYPKAKEHFKEIASWSSRNIKQLE